MGTGAGRRCDLLVEKGEHDLAKPSPKPHTLQTAFDLQLLLPKVMADMSELAKCLQEQVNIVTTYLSKEKLSLPSFIPSEQPTSMNSLPPEVEEARRKVHSLS